MSKEELVDVLEKLYNYNETTRLILDLMVEDESFDSGIVKAYKNRIMNLFFPENHLDELDFKEVYSVLDDFKSVSLGDPKLYGDVLLYSAECGLERITDIDYFYNYFHKDLKDLIANSLEFIRENDGLYEMWKYRIGSMMDTDVGKDDYGLGDFLEAQLEMMPQD